MRLAVVQCVAVDDDAAAVGEVLIDRLGWAAREDVDLLLFPEGFLLGHSYDAATIRRRAAQTSDGALAALCEKLRAFSTTLVVGAFERVGGDILNSAFVIAQGQVRGRYAKAHPNEPGVTAGTDFPIFEQRGVRYGINICNDANHPEAARSVADQGASLILFPLNNMLRAETAARWRPKSVENLVARARQTGCWVASADVTGEADGRISYGCTIIVRPDGEIVARVPEGREGVAIFDLPRTRPAG